MADRYHINPETGRVNKCTAAPGRCRFGAAVAHDSTKEAARERYEKEMASQLVPAVVKKTTLKKGDVRDEVSNLSPNELVLLKRRLRGQLFASDYKKLVIDHSTPVDVTFNRNGTSTFDYNDEVTQNYFTKGPCGFLAYAIHEKTGLPLTVISEDPDAEYWQGHVAVKLGEDRYLDVTGVVSTDELKSSYGLNPRKIAVEDMPSSEAFRSRMRVDEAKGVYGDLSELERSMLDHIASDLVRDFAESDKS